MFGVVYNTQIHVQFHFPFVKGLFVTWEQRPDPSFAANILHDAFDDLDFHGRFAAIAGTKLHKELQVPKTKCGWWMLMIILTTITQQTKVSVSGVSQWCLDMFDYIWILMFAPEVVADIRKSFDLFVFSSTVELIQFCVRSDTVRWRVHYVWHVSDCGWGPRDTHYSDCIIDERFHGDCCSHLSLQISRLFRKAPCGRPSANSKLEVNWTQEGSEEEYVIVGLTIPAARQQ